MTRSDEQGEQKNTEHMEKVGHSDMGVTDESTLALISATLSAFRNN